MPRYNVEHNGRWACFSSIVDAFITEFTNKESYENWRKSEYGTHDYEPAENRNRKTMEEAVFSTSLNRSRKEWIACLLECGLPQNEVDKLVYDCETKYYCPKPNPITGYVCPNCNRIVKHGQKECKSEDCGIRFVWRD